MTYVDLVSKLRVMYGKDVAAREIFDYLAERERNWEVTNVSVFLRHTDLPRVEVIRVLREFEELELGRFVTGRKGHKSRFVWDVPLTGVGQAAVGEIEAIEEDETIEGDADTEDEGEAMKSWSFPLRRDFMLSFELPADLTPSEAERLGAFIQALAIPKVATG